jgi:protein gp37
MAEKYSPGTKQTEGKNLVWFGEIERKLAKLSIPAFTYRSSS